MLFTLQHNNCADSRESYPPLCASPSLRATGLLAAHSQSNPYYPRLLVRHHPRWHQKKGFRVISIATILFCCYPVLYCNCGLPCIVTLPLLLLHDHTDDPPTPSFAFQRNRGVLYHHLTPSFGATTHTSDSSTPSFDVTSLLQLHLFCDAKPHHHPVSTSALRCSITFYSHPPVPASPHTWWVVLSLSASPAYRVVRSHSASPHTYGWFHHALVSPHTCGWFCHSLPFTPPPRSLPHPPLFASVFWYCTVSLSWTSLALLLFSGVSVFSFGGVLSTSGSNPGLPVTHRYRYHLRQAGERAGREFLCAYMLQTPPASRQLLSCCRTADAVTQLLQ